MPPLPLISVIMPVYNAEDTVMEAAASVLNGTFKQLELILVDDGSTDDSWAKLQSIQDPRVRLIQSDHQGVALASNRAAAASRAEWIARMDADDLSHPRRLEYQWEFAQQTGCDVVGGRVRIVNLEGDPVPSMQRYETWLNSLTDHAEIQAQRFVELPLVNPSMMARRPFFVDRCRNGPLPEDYDHWLGVLAEPGMRVGKTNHRILDWRDHSDRLTRKNPRYTKEAFDQCKRKHLLKGPLAGKDQVMLWGAGQTGKPWLQWLQAAGKEVPHVIEVSPKKIGQIIHGTPVISPERILPATGSSIPILAAVGAEGARQRITEHLKPLGYHAGENLWFVA